MQIETQPIEVIGVLLKLYLGGMGNTQPLVEEKGSSHQSESSLCHCPEGMLCSHLPTGEQLSSACTTLPGSIYRTQHNARSTPGLQKHDFSDPNPALSGFPVPGARRMPSGLAFYFIPFGINKNLGSSHGPWRHWGLELDPLPSPICERIRNQPLSVYTAVPSSHSSSRVRLLLSGWFQVRHPQKGLLGNAPPLAQPAPVPEPISWAPHSVFALENFPSPSGFPSGKTVSPGALPPPAKE